MNDQELLDQYDRLIQGTAAKMRRSYRLSAEDAEDIEQQARLVLCQIPADCREHSNYVITTVLNAARSELQRITRRRGREITLTAEPTVETPIADPIENMPSPETTDKAANIKLLISQILPELSLRQQAIITRAFGLDGQEPMTNREIAARLSLTKPIVDRHRAAAMAKLRQLASAGGKQIETRAA